jgi:alanyl-tRNA synthetase
MAMHQARELGAVMMFDEKYGDQVRVVSIGEYSRELCGGTHTHHSGELGSVVIASESGIGSGKRRIFAYAGQAALTYLSERVRLLDSVSQRIGARSPDEVAGRLDALLAEIESLRRDLEKMQHEQARGAAGTLAASARDINGVKVVAQAVQGASRADLERLVDAIRQSLGSGVVVLGSVSDGRVDFVAGVTRDLTSRVQAGKLIGAVAREAGGGGGGPPHFATGGGTQPAKLSAALQQAYKLVEQALQRE